MKVFKVSSYDHKVLATLFENTPPSAGKSYQAELQRVLGEVFVGTDFWQRPFAGNPDMELQEVLLNSEYLQRLWAQENHFTPTEPAWRISILQEQIKRFQPDVLFFHDQEFLDFEMQKVLLAVCSPRLIIAWDGIARCDAKRFSQCHLVLTNFPFVRDAYREAGLQSEVFPYSFNTAILQTTNPPKRIYPLTFAGSVVMRSDLHVRRMELLSGLSKHLPLVLRATGSILQWKWRERAQRRRIRHLQWADALNIHRLGKANLGPVHGLPMYQFLGESLVTFNVHIDKGQNVASNMRLFEATGMGACLLTDGGVGMEDYFVDGTEVVVYKNAPDCIEKARYLTQNPKAAAEIGQAGFQRTMRDHTFTARIPLLKHILDKYIR